MVVRGSLAISLSLSYTSKSLWYFYSLILLLFLKKLFAQLFIAWTVFTVLETQKNQDGLQNNHWISSIAYFIVLKSFTRTCPILPKFILLKRNSFIKNWWVTLKKKKKKELFLINTMFKSAACYLFAKSIFIKAHSVVDLPKAYNS